MLYSGKGGEIMLVVKRYSKELENEWEGFVRSSVNGTFIGGENSWVIILQTGFQIIP